MIRLFAIVFCLMFAPSANAQEKELQGVGKLQFGMTKAQVRAALGMNDQNQEPLVLGPEGMEGTTSFDEQGKLSEIVFRWDQTAIADITAKNVFALTQVFSLYDSLMQGIIARHGPAQYRRDPVFPTLGTPMISGSAAWYFKQNRRILLKVSSDELDRKMTILLQLIYGPADKYNY